MQCDCCNRIVTYWHDVMDAPDMHSCEQCVWWKLSFGEPCEIFQFDIQEDGVGGLTEYFNCKTNSQNYCNACMNKYFQDIKLTTERTYALMTELKFYQLRQKLALLDTYLIQEVFEFLGGEKIRNMRKVKTFKKLIV